ncbi:hypothetical protein COCON_G00113520 [Conger conger]|uniref:RPGRIP1 C-terminal domain-containing protein n=1 Tax=Conger conger TaxID=82655 RepID=A0A9Q1DGA7_CONCO|nr:hypothetical protein COCON_G00113520 [Conger conger]
MPTQQGDCASQDALGGAAASPGGGCRATGVARRLASPSRAAAVSHACPVSRVCCRGDWREVAEVAPRARGVGLRTLGGGQDGARGEVRGQEVVTFCTYSLLDFETHSTPLVSGPSRITASRRATPCQCGTWGRSGRGGRVRVELHQALGVQFETRGQAWILLSGAAQRTEERLSGTTNITECTSIHESVMRLFSQELFDYGGGIPNELEVLLDRCMGLSTHWPGLFPDAYLLYRLYDLPPHTTSTMPCSADPVFGDVVSYPLALTADLLAYLQGGSLWVYAFNDRDRQPTGSYLAKTPIPLHNLAMGRPVRGDYVLRDAGGCSRGIVRVSLRWRHRFQPPGALQITESPQRPITQPRDCLEEEEEEEEERKEKVQRVYVEYRLLGIPMETTETPISLRKPSGGEEIHFNFIRVIHVAGVDAGPLRQYLYTMLEGTDPNQGRLKFTVVSDPMEDEEEECVDISHAYLDLKEVLLTGIVGVGEEEDRVGRLKVSLEAACALEEIYWEQRRLREREQEEQEEEEEEEQEEEEQEEEKQEKE